LLWKERNKENVLERRKRIVERIVEWRVGMGASSNSSPITLDRDRDRVRLIFPLP